MVQLWCNYGAIWCNTGRDREGPGGTSLLLAGGRHAAGRPARQVANYFPGLSIRFIYSVITEWEWNDELSFPANHGNAVGGGLVGGDLRTIVQTNLQKGLFFPTRARFL